MFAHNKGKTKLCITDHLCSEVTLPTDSPHKGPVIQKVLSWNSIIMYIKKPDRRGHKYKYLSVDSIADSIFLTLSRPL